MDQDEFTKGYFRLLAAKLAPHGYEPKTLIDTVWRHGRYGKEHRRADKRGGVLGDVFQTYGAETERDKPLFQNFYAVDFERARAFCPRNDKAAETVAKIKTPGHGTRSQIRFSRAATSIRWLWTRAEDFQFARPRENSQTASRTPITTGTPQWFGLSPEECLMVGNDAGVDKIENGSR